MCTTVCFSLIFITRSLADFYACSILFVYAQPFVYRSADLCTCFISYIFRLVDIFPTPYPTYCWSSVLYTIVHTLSTYILSKINILNTTLLMLGVNEYSPFYVRSRQNVVYGLRQICFCLFFRGKLCFFVVLSFVKHYFSAVFGERSTVF